MKCLSIQQPWASFILGTAPGGHRGPSSIKDVENRTWKTPYTGPLLIHSPQKFDAEGFEEIYPDDIRTQPGFKDQFPTGCIVGIVDLVGCSEMDDKEPYKSEWSAYGQKQLVLENPRRLAKPYPYKGNRGLFNVPDDVVRTFRFITIGGQSMTPEHEDNGATGEEEVETTEGEAATLKEMEEIAAEDDTPQDRVNVWLDDVWERMGTEIDANVPEDIQNDIRTLCGWADQPISDAETEKPLPPGTVELPASVGPISLPPSSTKPIEMRVFIANTQPNMSLLAQMDRQGGVRLIAAQLNIEAYAKRKEEEDDEPEPESDEDPNQMKLGDTEPGEEPEDEEGGETDGEETEETSDDEKELVGAES